MASMWIQLFPLAIASISKTTTLQVTCDDAGVDFSYRHSKARHAGSGFGHNLVAIVLGQRQSHLAYKVRLQLFDFCRRKFSLTFQIDENGNRLDMKPGIFGRPGFRKQPLTIDVANELRVVTQESRLFRFIDRRTRPNNEN